MSKVSQKHIGLKVYVEGGGNSNALKTKCRQSFTTFLKKAGLGGSMPRIVACGTRKAAYDDFCTALKNGEPALLLVDSEDLVAETHKDKPWAHLAARKGDKWQRPEGAEDDQCHLMVVCMESWFLADREQLANFFAQGFQVSALPSPQRSVESIAKETVYDALEKATSNCKTKSVYGKGEHSFDLLTMLDPQKVMAASPWAARFVKRLRVDDITSVES